MMTGRAASPQRYRVQETGFARPARPSFATTPTHRTLSNRTLIAAGGCALALLLWALAATGFVVFRDDVVSAMIRREASMQYDYESRISVLKAELSRVRSKQLVDQQAFADKIETLIRRQSSLESRQSIVQSLGEIAASAGVGAGLGHAGAPAAPTPLPDSDDSIKVLRPGKQARLDLRPARHASMVEGFFSSPAPQPAKPGVTERLSALSTDLDRLERQQIQALSMIGSTARTRANLIRDAFDIAGLDPDQLLRAHLGGASEGGPFIPLELAPNASAFEAIAHEVQKALSEADSLNRALESVPLRRPFPDAPITSGFGARIDPFLGRNALHAGIDFREESGAPVEATASGRVTEAGWMGGYGNMVEIDHGGGLSTRFGHLSAVLVSVGDKVGVGDTIGKVGSTGRSTGPHLHYETRVNDVAVDPMRFLRAEQILDRAPL